VRDDLLVGQSDKIIRRFNVVDLAARVAVDLNQRRDNGFTDGNIEPILRWARRAAACRLENQFIANALPDAARYRRDVDRRELLLRSSAADRRSTVQRLEAGATGAFERDLSR